MRTRTPRILFTLLAGAALLAPTAPAHAAASDPAVPISPSTVTLNVTGHGWGHGHGMSQYGAQGAARQGLSYVQILKFYYNNIPLSSTSGGIRVLITADTDNNTTVRPTRGLRVTDLGNGRTYRLPTTKHPKAWRLRTVSGKTRIYYRTAKWHLYKTGGRTALAGAGQFRARGPLTLRLASGDARYRGALRFVNSDTVNVLGLEKYLKGVVPSEMSPSWKPAALQAQAVAARTYAARERADNAGRYYNICDTQSCQVYGGLDDEWSTTNAAVDATAGKILTYQGEPAFAQFSSSSGGWMSAGSEPYLVTKQDPYDKPVDPVAHIGDPNFDWTVKVPVARLRSAYGAGTLTSVQINVRENPGTLADWGGRALQIVLNGSHGPMSFTGDSSIRSLLGVKSSYLALSPS